jgi:hypothetical protein
MMFTHNPALRRTTVSYGAVAQLIERVVRNDEVRGLIPLCSTKFLSGLEGKVPTEA